jgi:hypothetical protein
MGEITIPQAQAASMVHRSTSRRSKPKPRQSFDCPIWSNDNNRENAANYIRAVSATVFIVVIPLLRCDVRRTR